MITSDKICRRVDVWDRLGTLDFCHGISTFELCALIREAQICDIAQLVLRVVCDSQMAQNFVLDM